MNENDTITSLDMQSWFDRAMSKLDALGAEWAEADAARAADDELQRLIDGLPTNPPQWTIDEDRRRWLRPDCRWLPEPVEVVR